MKLTYTHTRIGCYINFFLDAVVNVYLGLCFVTWIDEFGVDIVDLAKMSCIIFGVQAVLIPVAAIITGKIGFRRAAVIMQIFYCIGISGLGIFPYVMPTPFSGLVTAAVIFALGNGICEAINPPIIESLPLKNKDKQMRCLHSSFSIGQIIVILVSTLFFITVGRDHWQILAIIFGMIALCNMVIFLKAPFGKLVEEKDRTPLKQIIGKKMFLILVVMIICTGPIEFCMANWTSLFAEQALHVSKTVGDLLGPCLFAVGMASSRLFFGLKGANIDMDKFMMYSCLGCCLSFPVVAFSPVPLLCLIACGLVGLTTGIVCPGCICDLSKSFPKGGVPMFGAMMLFQYLGGSAEEYMVGSVTNYVQIHVPQICLDMFPVTDPYELGLRTALFFVSWVATLMFIFSCLSYRYIKKHGIRRQV